MNGLITQDTLRIFGVYKDGSLVGWTLSESTPERVVIEYICVDPTYWRQGLGSALINNIRSQYPNKTISLVTMKINPISPKFYAAVGFRKTDFTLDEYDKNLVQGFELGAK